MTDKAEEFATPSSPESPEELTEALDAYRHELIMMERKPTLLEPDYQEELAKVTAARSALVSLYNRQREEIERLRGDK